MATLVLIRGIPGSGKSTMAREEYPDFLHYETDHLFCDTHGRYRFELHLRNQAAEWVYAMVDFALSRGENVVVTAVVPRLSGVAKYAELAEYHEATFKVVEPSGTFGSIHNVPKTVIESMAASFEPYCNEEPDGTTKE